MAAPPRASAGRRPMKLRLVPLLMLCLVALIARAAAPAAGSSSGLHAYLDRDRATSGDTVTLNIEGAAALSGAPDLSPLQKDFDVLGTSSSSKVQIVNGVSHSTTQLGIALRIGNRQTQPLGLQVTTGAAGALGHSGDPAFLEAGVDSSAPYVGQQIV